MSEITGEYVDDTLKMFWVADIKLKGDYGLLKNCWIYNINEKEPINNKEEIEHKLKNDYNRIDFQNKRCSGYTSAGNIEWFKIHKILSN